ncbi:hypothetical protein BDN72DRAFT_380741 [Pluteus cervinus]|uniref:Uncharacterized protein n=1 Tax=Pluteus cervinus TaxID=181527 RepID=A0ACD3B2Y1_9AGAR|nr:hypothetical protein BDN72DRAFT_380741 [Pluteus cervinus]
MFWVGCAPFLWMRQVYVIIRALCLYDPLGRRNEHRKSRWVGASVSSGNANLALQLMKGLTTGALWVFSQVELILQLFLRQHVALAIAGVLVIYLAKGSMGNCIMDKSQFGDVHAIWPI